MRKEVAKQDVRSSAGLRPLRPSTKNLQEHEKVRLFCQTKASEIFSNSHSEFWNHYVLQLAQTDDAVWCVILAFDHLYSMTATRHPSIRNGNDGMSHNDESLKFSNKAITHLMAKKHCASEIDKTTVIISCEYPSPDTIMEDHVLNRITGVLFACMEFIRGSLKVALAHLRSGWQINQERVLASNSIVSHDLMAGELNQAFGRLRLQSLLIDALVHAPAPDWTAQFGRPIFHPNRVNCFSSLAMAREHLYSLSQQSMSLIYNTDSLKYTDQLESAHFATQKRLEYSWLSWENAMDILISENTHSWTQRDIRAAKSLLMLAISEKIWVACCLTPFQTAFDAWFTDFQKIVTLGEEVVALGLPIFQCDPGIIMPLNTTAYKCRHPIIRRRALKLFLSGFWREGSFSNEMAYRWCHRIVEFEEASLLLQPLSSSLADSLPPESARIHMTSGDREKGTGTRIRFLVMPVPWTPQLIDEMLSTTGELPPIPELVTYTTSSNDSEIGLRQ